MSNTINLSQIKRQITLVKKVGNDVVIDEKADKAIGQLFMFQKQLDEALKEVKAQVADALAPFNAKSLKGKYVTISVAEPRRDLKYKVDDEASAKFAKQRISYTPDVEAIEQYIDEKGQLPQGVHLSGAKKVVRVTPKAV
ncbi:gp157-like protein [Caudoviricetes sp.]|nr:gp157-like protein [Caudoviricetes sp.]